MLLGRSWITFKTNRSIALARTQARKPMSNQDATNVVNIAAAAAAAARPASATTPSLLSDYLPISVLTDSYKATHFLQYPEAKKMVAVSRHYLYLMLFPDRLST
jgi:hypothetical protein